MQGIADNILDEWRLVWGDATAQDWSGMEPGEALIRPTVDQVRKAARSFCECTAVSGHFLHPRMIQWLDDIAIELLIDIILLVEETGVGPV